MLLSKNEIAIQNEDYRPAAIGDLQLFKMLFQPHFLFNSLNNLYALSVQQSDRTADAIAGLSEMLEKVVSCSRREMISLTEEIALIRDYIKLEKIWLGVSNMVVDLQVSGNTNDIMIPPLVLYTFVENSFKHGIRKCGANGWLKIKISAKQDKFVFSTRNMVPKYEHAEVSCENRQGFGIPAAEELLKKNFKRNYKLQYGLTEKTYCVDLEIYKNNIEN